MNDNKQPSLREVIRCEASKGTPVRKTVDMVRSLIARNPELLDFDNPAHPHQLESRKRWRQ